MRETPLEFVWPSLPDAIPVLLIFVVLPGWLVWLVFMYTSLSRWKKALLLPVCMITPILVTAFWPFVLKASGIITGTGGHQPPYSWYSQKLFGSFSDYIWASLTALAILVVRGMLKSKTTPDPPSQPSAGSGG